MDEEAAITAEKIRKIIEVTPATIMGNKELAISASFGVSDVGGNLDELLHGADEVMYKVKSAGRNGVGIYKPKDEKKKTKNSSNKSAYTRASLLKLRQS